jgi:hypothetical protein
MVGVGGVIMVTPLHPIGHAMAIGGVAVLGTEFEGPRKAMNKVNDAFAKRKHSSPTQQEQREPTREQQ